MKFSRVVLATAILMAATPLASASSSDDGCSVDTPFGPATIYVSPGKGQVTNSETPVSVSFWHQGDYCPTAYTLQRSVNGGPWATVARGRVYDYDDETFVKDSMRFHSVYRYRMYVSSDEGRTEALEYPAVTAQLIQEGDGIDYSGGPWTLRRGNGYSGGRSMKSTGPGVAELSVSALGVGFVATREPSGGDWYTLFDGRVWWSGYTTRAATTTYRVVHAGQGLDNLLDGAQRRTFRFGIGTSRGGVDVDAVVLIQPARSAATSVSRVSGPVK